MSFESIDWPLFGKQAGIGFVLGFAVGFAAKKVLKVAFIAVGVLLVILVTLQHYDMVSIHWSHIEAVYNDAVNPPGGLNATVKGWVDSLAAIVPGAGGFAFGFLWGMRRG